VFDRTTSMRHRAAETWRIGRPGDSAEAARRMLWASMP
jgi:hypothetical protein